MDPKNNDPARSTRVRYQFHLDTGRYSDLIWLPSDSLCTILFWLIPCSIISFCKIKRQGSGGRFRFISVGVKRKQGNFDRQSKFCPGIIPAMWQLQYSRAQVLHVSMMSHKRLNRDTGSFEFVRDLFLFVDETEKLWWRWSSTKGPASNLFICMVLGREGRSTTAKLSKH